MVSTPRSSGWGPPGARLATSCARTCSVGSAGVVSSRWRMVRSDAGNGTRRCCISGDGRASPRSGPQSCWSRTRTARGPRRPPAAAQETLRMCVIDSYPPRAPTEREGGEGGERTAATITASQSAGRFNCRPAPSPVAARHSARSRRLRRGPCSRLTAKTRSIALLPGVRRNVGRQSPRREQHRQVGGGVGGRRWRGPLVVRRRAPRAGVLQPPRGGI